MTTVPTFSEFIDYVIEETTDLMGPRDWKGVMTWKSYTAKVNKQRLLSAEYFSLLLIV